MDPIIALFKLGEEARMAELLHEGHVYMNTVSFFAKLEEASPRSDPDEGTSYCENAEGATFQMQQGDEWHTLGTLSGAIRLRNDALATANLYCLHAKTRRDYGTVFELNQLGFGDSYVLFLNANEFLRRLTEAAAAAGQNLVYGMVDYVDRRSYTGPMGVFRKFSERAADREFRVAILPGTGRPLCLRLGDLSDIAIMGMTSERLRLDNPAYQAARAESPPQPEI